MHPASIVGGVLLVVGVAGYVAGVLAPYPGRSFSLTAVTVGIALVAIGPSLERREASAP